MLRERNSQEKSQIFLNLQVCLNPIAFAKEPLRSTEVVLKVGASVLYLESEPRDAGTDQRSSGIIRLHTIKQIIDRVSTFDLWKIQKFSILNVQHYHLPSFMSPSN